MGVLLPAVEIEPDARAESAPACVLWLHGLGADGHDFEPIVPYLQLPHARYVFPHAPRRAVTINGGFVMPAWYDITSLRGDADQGQMRETLLQVAALLEREEQRVSSRRIVLAGFSQGGAMALLAGLRHPRPLAGILVLSAYRPRLTGETAAQEEHPANTATPILFCHGSADELVPAARGRAACDELTAGGRPVEWREFPIGHEVSMPEIQLVADWLHRCLP
jgi:phospholipase/carboxylesterase